MVNYPKSIPVVIVGAGPTGLAAANLLATYGVECVVLDREDKPLDLPRAIVLDDEGARTLQVFRLDEYVSSTTASVGSRYYDDEGVTFAERTDVQEREDLVISVDLVTWDVSGEDLLENGICHARNATTEYPRASTRLDR